MNKNRARSSAVKNILILVIILFMPGFFYFFLQEKGVNKYQTLPYYGAPNLSVETDTIRTHMSNDTRYTVPIIDLYNEDGNKMEVPVSDTTISIINFFYTECPSFCMRMNQTIYRVAERFSKSQMVRFYSISVDPKDTPPRLKQYVNRFGLQNSNWHFFSANDRDLMALSRNRYFLDALRDSSHSNVIIHSPDAVLLDSKRHIRGYYNSTDPQDVDRLMDEMRVLLTEERRNKNQ